MSERDDEHQQNAESNDEEQRRREIVAKFEAMDGEEARGQISVLPFYHLVQNEIIQPNRGTFVTTYFRRRWRPVLGSDGASFVEALRQLADKESGRTFASVKKIAEVAGLSVSTVERFLSRKAPRVWKGKRLIAWQHIHQYFILEFRPRYRIANAQDGPVKRRTTSLIRVAMDEPIHPDDEPNLFVKTAERIVQGENRDTEKPVVKQGFHPNRQSDGQGHLTVTDHVENSDPNRHSDGHIAPSLRGSVSVSYRSSSTSAMREISPKRGSAKATSFAKDPRVANLTREKRAENDAFVAELCAWINDKEGSLDGGHQYEGLFRRGVYFINDIPEIRLMQRRLSDELQDEYGHHTPKQGTVSRRLWGYMKRFATQNGIDLTPQHEEPSEAK